jgi:hypothetical protein
VNNLPPTSAEISLSEHLKGFSAVNARADAAVKVLEKHLRQFGPVAQTRIADVTDGLSYLIPIKSFATRYLILEVGDWSLMLADMRGANCYVEAYAIRRATLCNAIGLFAQQEHRELQLFEKGEKVRQVQSLRDGDKWYYREKGPLQPFEDADELFRKNKEERLKVEALHRYFKSYTSLSVPNWNAVNFSSIVGLERSTKDLRVQIIEFKTLLDLLV